MNSSLDNASKIMMMLNFGRKLLNKPMGFWSNVGQADKLDFK